MMIRLSFFGRFRILAMAAGLAFACSAASAQQQAPGERESASPNAERAVGAASAGVDAQAPNARLTALVDSGGRVVRSTNVDYVTNPRPGVYCIRPETRLNLNRMIAVVSVEFFYSRFSEALVQWRSDPGFFCPDEHIEVYTLGDPNLNGSYVRTDGIAFTILVP